MSASPDGGSRRGRVRLAIVGSTAFEQDTPESVLAYALILAVIHEHDPDEIVSGGATGIDSMAAEVSTAMGIPFVEFIPKNKRWEPDGYKARNMLIAETCDVLVCIRHHASKTYGSGWTADRAEEMGKTVRRYMVYHDGFFTRGDTDA